MLLRKRQVQSVELSRRGHMFASCQIILCSSFCTFGLHLICFMALLALNLHLVWQFLMISYKTIIEPRNHLPKVLRRRAEIPQPDRLLSADLPKVISPPGVTSPEAVTRPVLVLDDSKRREYHSHGVVAAAGGLRGSSPNMASRRVIFSFSQHSSPVVMNY